MYVFILVVDIIMRSRLLQKEVNRNNVTRHVRTYIRKSYNIKSRKYLQRRHFKGGLKNGVDKLWFTICRRNVLGEI